MKRSFIDARIEAMLAMCDTPWRAAAAVRALVRGGISRRSRRGAPHRRARPRLEHRRVQARRFATRGARACSRCAWATGASLPTGRGRLYAEKALLAEDGQRTPHHYHIVKTEDIVNRGGARFVVELVKVDRAGAPLKERFRVVKDVTTLDLGPGDQVAWSPAKA